MKALSATAIIAALLSASCGCFHRSQPRPVEASAPRTWLLLVAPFTREFPHGDLDAPYSKWSQVRSFDSAAGCDAILQHAQDNLQRPVQCLASDDPRLKPAPAANP